MIERYVDGDVFKTSDDLLFVPLAIGETEFDEGFAGQVMKRFANVELRLRAHGGLEAAEVLIVDDLGFEQSYLAAYSVALCGIHNREERGWAHAPANMEIGMDAIYGASKPGTRMATAGIPGTGFSGLRGDAPVDSIRNVMMQHPLRISVYNDGFANSPAMVSHSLLPPLDTGETVELILK